MFALRSAYPWGAVVVWMVFAFLFGLAASALYARTRRLGPPIVAHYVLNLIPFVAFVASPPH
jgi:membrane protease YdiL (CAAX protease family)